MKKHAALGLLFVLMFSLMPHDVMAAGTRTGQTAQNRKNKKPTIEQSLYKLASFRWSQLTKDDTWNLAKLGVTIGGLYFIFRHTNIFDYRNTNYRNRQQEHNQRPVTPSVTTQPNANSSSIQNGIFRPRPRRATVQEQAYAAFNHNLGTQLNLPGVTGSLRNCPGAYHVFSNAELLQQRGWTCGFHALHNMCLIEHIILGRNIEQNNFDRACRAVVGNRTTDASTNRDIDTIAQRLNVTNVYHLNAQNGDVQPLVSQFTIWNRESRAYAIRRTQAQLANDMWPACTNILNRNGAQVIHFVGHIMSHNEQHAVLVSVVKLRNGSKALYIFDNINGHEDRNAQEQIRRLAQHIYDQLMR